MSQEEHGMQSSTAARQLFEGNMIWLIDVINVTELLVSRLGIKMIEFQIPGNSLDFVGVLSNSQEFL